MGTQTHRFVVTKEGREAKRMNSYHTAIRLYARDVLNLTLERGEPIPGTVRFAFSQEIRSVVDHYTKAAEEIG